MGRRLHLRASAKINLRLEIQGKRPDGYHSVRTWIYPISLWDEIVVEEAPEGIEVIWEGGKPPPLKDDLCWRAASLFFARKGGGRGVKITLKKGIPIGAGLGGGSSDAASVLQAMNILYGGGFGREELMEMGASLGADVPFFLLGRGAVMGGVGEKPLLILPPLKRWIVLVVPPLSLSTKEVYERWGLTRSPGENRISLGPPPQSLEGFLRNDLEEVAEGLCPEILEIKEELQRVGAEGVLMTGSGPGVFGLFPSEEAARRGQEGLSPRRGWQVFRVMVF